MFFYMLRPIKFIDGILKKKKYETWNIISPVKKTTYAHLSFVLFSAHLASRRKKKSDENQIQIAITKRTETWMKIYEINNNNS